MFKYVRDLGLRKIPTDSERMHQQNAHGVQQHTVPALPIDFSRQTIRLLRNAGEHVSRCQTILP